MANNIGREGRGAKSTTGIRNFNVRGSPVRERRKIGLNQSLIYINPCPPLPPQIFYLLLFHSAAKRKLFLGRKDIGGGMGGPPPQVTPVDVGCSRIPH